MFQKMNSFHLNKLASALALTLVASTALVLPTPAQAKDTLKDMQDFEYVLSTGILQGMLAKELCTCRFVVGISMDACQEHSQFPSMAFNVVLISEDPVKKTMTVYPNVPLSTVPAMAIFDTEHPRKGCHMAYGMLDYKNGIR